MAHDIADLAVVDAFLHDADQRGGNAGLFEIGERLVAHLAQIGAADAAALKKLAKQAGEAAQLLKLLGNEKRLLILCFLAVRGEMTVGELVGVVKLSQSALSQHLARLREDGLVVFRRTSQTLHYSVADKRALRVLQVLKEIYCGDVR